MDLTEAENIKKRWQEYTEELYKKCLPNPGNHNGVITHLEPDILECEVKCALGLFSTVTDEIEFISVVLLFFPMDLCHLRSFIPLFCLL